MPAIFKTDCHESFGNKCNRMESFDIFPKKHNALSLCDSDHFRINWRRVTELPLQDPAVASRAVAPRGLGIMKDHLVHKRLNRVNPSMLFSLEGDCVSVCLSMSVSLVVSRLWSPFFHTLSYSPTSPKHMSSHQFRSMQSMSGIMQGHVIQATQVIPSQVTVNSADSR